MSEMMDGEQSKTIRIRVKQIIKRRVTWLIVEVCLYRVAGRE